MISFIGERSSGKTKKMLQCAAAMDNAVVVCKNVYSMKVKATNYGFFEGIEFVCYDDLIDKQIEDLEHKKVFIDDLDEYVNYSLGGTSFAGYTLAEDY